MKAILSEQLLSQQAPIHEEPKTAAEKVYDQLKGRGMLKGSRGLEICIDPKTEEFIIGFRGDLQNSLMRVLVDAGKDPETINKEEFFTKTIE